MSSGLLQCWYNKTSLTPDPPSWASHFALKPISICFQSKSPSTHWISFTSTGSSLDSNKSLGFEPFLLLLHHSSPHLRSPILLLVLIKRAICALNTSEVRALAAYLINKNSSLIQIICHYRDSDTQDASTWNWERAHLVGNSSFRKTRFLCSSSLSYIPGNLLFFFFFTIAILCYLHERGNRVGGHMSHLPRGRQSSEIPQNWCNGHPSRVPSLHPGVHPPVTHTRPDQNTPAPQSGKEPGLLRFNAGSSTS